VQSTFENLNLEPTLLLFTAAADQSERTIQTERANGEASFPVAKHSGRFCQMFINAAKLFYLRRYSCAPLLLKWCKAESIASLTALLEGFVNR
jgi:hypothetical protein